MKKSCVIQITSALCLGAVLVSGCTASYEGPGVAATVSTGPADVYVDSAPPPPQEEPVPASPGPDFIWIGGNWAWDGGHWRWEHGRWERPPHAGMHYVPHQYAYRNGRHVFHRGGWTR